MIATLRSGGVRGEEAVVAVASLLALTVQQVRAAVRYCSAYPAEVDERIRHNVNEADESA